MLELSFPKNNSPILQSNIKELTLSFSDEILEKLVSFKQLETLNLRSLYLTTAKSEYLLHLPQLRRLGLNFHRYARITEDVFEIIAQIPLLEELVLDTELAGFVFDSDKYTHLHLIKKWIITLGQLGKLDQISCLKFSIQSDEHHEAMKVVTKLKNIRDLAINYVDGKKTVIAAQDFLKCPKLEKITTSSCTLIEPLSELSKLPFLKLITSENIAK